MNSIIDVAICRWFLNRPSRKFPNIWLQGRECSPRVLPLWFLSRSLPLCLGWEPQANDRKICSSLLTVQWFWNVVGIVWHFWPIARILVVISLGMLRVVLRCGSGVGWVQIQNCLSEQVATCKLIIILIVMMMIYHFAIFQHMEQMPM